MTGSLPLKRYGANNGHISGSKLGKQSTECLLQSPGSRVIIIIHCKLESCYYFILYFIIIIIIIITALQRTQIIVVLMQSSYSVLMQPERN